MCIHYAHFFPQMSSKKGWEAFYFFCCRPFSQILLEIFRSTGKCTSSLLINLRSGLLLCIGYNCFMYRCLLSDSIQKAQSHRNAGCRGLPEALRQVGRAWLHLAQLQKPWGQSFRSLLDDLPRCCTPLLEIFPPVQSEPSTLHFGPLSPLTLSVAAALSSLCHLPTSPQCILSEEP